MTVAQLIAELQKMPPEAQVLFDLAGLSWGEFEDVRLEYRLAANAPVVVLS